MADRIDKKPADKHEPEDLSTIREPLFGIGATDPSVPKSGLTPDPAPKPALDATDPALSTAEFTPPPRLVPDRGQPTVPLAGEPTAFTTPIPGNAAPTAPDSASPSKSASSVQAVNDVRPGMILFDRYLVDWQIGSGGMGTVWKVKHKVLGVSRALKLIRPQIAFDPKTRADFRREATIMATLHHPNAVMVHDAQIGSDLAYIEMELLEGESIEKKLDPGKPMPLDWVTRVLLQLCELLDFVHAKGVIHRDLKPSNLMLLSGQPAGREFLKVLDFGIAKSLKEDSGDPEDIKTGTGGARFTPHYASPEQVGGARDLDARSDLYSVGVILYEFLTGYRPFSEPGLIYQHLCVEPPSFKARNPKANVASGIEAVVMRCLSKDPNQRPQSAAELGDAFLEAVEATGLAITIASNTSSRWDSRASEGFRPRTTTALPKATFSDDHEIATGRRSRGLLMTLVLVPVLIGLLFFGIKTVRDRMSPPSATTKGVAVEPKTSKPAAPRKALALGFSADARTGYDSDGWPEEIIEQESQRRFIHFSDGRYIPDTVNVVDRNDVVNGWPRVLECKGGVVGRFIRIEGGTFKMGGLIPPSENEDEQPNDIPVHEVTLDDFYLHETEISNRQMSIYLEQMADRRPDSWAEYYSGLKEPELSKLPDRAANNVSRAQAARCAHWMRGRLPTEAEWEYAARSRGRADRPYPWGREVATTAFANISSAESNRDSPIAIAASGRYSKDRTEQGILDLAGNVREWCYDVYVPYSAKPVTVGNPPTLIPQSDKEYVVRGSSFSLGAEEAVTTARGKERGDQTAADLGFRVILIVPPQMKGLAN